MTASVTNNRWVLSTVVAAIIVVLATLGSGSWGSHASAATTAVGTVPVFSFQFGTSGSGVGEFENPFGIAFDPSGNVYVSDYNTNRILKFSSTGTYISTFGSSGTGDGQFDAVADIAIDSQGNIYVSDEGTVIIQKFDSSGTFVSKWGSSGTGPGQFDAPLGLAVDSSGNVYVTDINAHNVQKFDSDGNFLLKFGTGTASTADGDLDTPFDVAVGSDGSVYIADSGNNRISKFNSNGTFAAKWGTLGTGDGQFSSLYGVDIDSLGRIYASDYDEENLQKFDSDGNFLAKFGTSGSGPGQLDIPYYFAVNSQGDVYVADYGNASILVFTQDWIPAAPTSVAASSAGSATASVSWTAPANGGSAITGYTVTSSPGGVTANSTVTSADVTGLVSGVEYTFTVTATNGIGVGPSSTASNAITLIAPEAGLILTDLTVTSALKLKTGQVVLLSASPLNELSAVNLDMPSVDYTWAIDTCGTLSSTSDRTPIYTAPTDAGCTATVSVHASQGGGAQVPSSDREIKIVVTAPPEPVATVAPADPVVIPTIVPVGLNSDDVSLILPTTGGTFSVPQEAGDTAPPISLDVPGGALENGTANAVTINVISTGDLAAPPPPATEGTTSGTFSFGSTVIEVQWYDDDGNALDTKKLNKPAKICVPYVMADANTAAGGPDGMSVWRYNGTAWVKLNSSVNISDGTVCAYTSNFSVFALGLDVAPPAEAGSGSGLPATGGYTPNALTLALSMLAGLALIVSGVVAIRRTKRASTVL